MRARRDVAVNGGREREEVGRALSGHSRFFFAPQMLRPLVLLLLLAAAAAGVAPAPRPRPDGAPSASRWATTITPDPDYKPLM